MTTAPDRRRGFTLVELLVTLLLIAILAALTTGAVFRVLAGEKNRATEATLSKLNTGLDRQWKAVMDDAREDIDTSRLSSTTMTALMAYAGGDKDRAKVIWSYLKLKNEFPTTIAEARTPAMIVGLPTVSLPPRQVFLQQLPLTGTGTAEEAAACFYIAVTATAHRGETMGADGVNQQTADVMLPGGTRGNKIFVDAWGTPITFVRMAYGAEVNNPPYVRGGVVNRDFCDPQGKLRTFSPTWDATRLNTSFWPSVRLNHINYTGFPGATAYPADPAPSNAPWNWVPTVVSAGPDGEWGTDIFGGDNLVGYRTRREGARGD